MVARRLLLSWLVAAVFWSALPLSAHAEQGDLYEKARAVARTEIWKDINTGRACSASVAIMDNGVVVYSEGFGMADREKSVPVDRTTLFNIGSISKVYTSVAVMLLVDDGKVILDDPVTKYLPEFVMADPRHKRITVRMLLNHTSGLPGTTAANDFGFAYNPNFFKQVLDNLATSRLKHEPGALGPYCNDGFTLAEMLVERVSGKKFLTFLSERVSKPLSLKDTGAGVGVRPGEKAAFYYQPDTGKREPLQVLSLIGCGGLGSTPEDLCRFLDMFSGKGPPILSPSSLAEMRKNQVNDDMGFKHPISYGLGWDVTSLSAYRPQVLGKSGGTQRYSSMMFTVPDHRLSVAVIECGLGGNAEETATRVLDEVLAAKGLAGKVRKPVSRPPGRQPIPPGYAAFDGYYLTPEPLRVSFDLKKNLVILKSLGEEARPPVSLYYHGGTFYDKTGSPSYFLSSGGERYYIACFSLWTVDMVRAQKLKKLEKPQTLAIDMNARKWLLRSTLPFEGICTSAGHIGTSRTLADLPGYVDFGGILVVLSPDSAGMAGTRIRDLNNLVLMKKGKTTWARLSDTIWSPAEAAPSLGSCGGTTLTIGPEGYSEWLKVGTGMVLGFQKPARGRVIVFNPEGSPIYDSLTHQGDVYAPEGTLIEFAGYPGDALEVRGQ